MKGIPISFEHHGGKFSGYFAEVTGAGSGEHATWYLMGNDKYYYGCLRLVFRDPLAIDNPMQEKKPEAITWFFDENAGSKGFSNYLDYFREVVTAWYQ